MTRAKEGDKLTMRSGHCPGSPAGSVRVPSRPERVGGEGGREVYSRPFGLGTGAAQPFPFLGETPVRQGSTAGAGRTHEVSGCGGARKRGGPPSLLGWGWVVAARRHTSREPPGRWWRPRTGHQGRRQAPSMTKVDDEGSVALSGWGGDYHGVPGGRGWLGLLDVALTNRSSGWLLKRSALPS